MSMRWMKWFTGFLLTLIVVFSLGACGSSLEKPTGLEDTDNQQAEMDIQENDDKELNDEKSFNDEKQETTDEVEAETSKEEIESDGNKNGSKTESGSEDKNKSNTDSKTTNKKTASNDNKSSKKSSQDNGSKKTESKRVDKSNKSTSDSSKNKPKKEKKKDKPKKNPEKEKDKPKPDPKPKKDTIIHSIVISEETNEIPLPPTETEIKNGDTVLEALIAITMENKIHMDYRGGQGATAYVQGMGNVYEFDRGQGSGWMYRINGIFPDRGAGVVPLCDGDRVEWLYTTNLGEDLGADLKPVRRNGKCPK